MQGPLDKWQAQFTICWNIGGLAKTVAVEEDCRVSDYSHFWVK